MLWRNLRRLTNIFDYRKFIVFRLQERMSVNVCNILVRKCIGYFPLSVALLVVNIATMNAFVIVIVILLKLDQLLVELLINDPLWIQNNILTFVNYHFLAHEVYKPFRVEILVNCRNEHSFRFWQFKRFPQVLSPFPKVKPSEVVNDRNMVYVSATFWVKLVSLHCLTPIHRQSIIN